MTIVKNLIENPSIFHQFRVLLCSSTTSEMFLIYAFLAMKRRPYKMFLQKQDVFKLGPVEYAILFFQFLVYDYQAFCQKSYEKIIIF